MHALAHWFGSGDWRPTFGGIATLLTAVVALGAAVVAYRSVKTQISAERSAREKECERERYATAAEMRSEVVSIWEVDMRTFSSVMRRGLPQSTGTSLVTRGRPLPQAPDRYFPVFETCAEKVGLLDRETVALTVQFYKRVNELFSEWGEYNRDSTMSLERFKRLYEQWKGLENGYGPLLAKLDEEQNP